MISNPNRDFIKQKSFIIVVLILLVFIISILGISLRMGFFYLKTVDSIATLYELDTSLVMAICMTESGFDKKAISSVGAVGIMQLMPKTAEAVCRLNNIEYSYSCLFDAEYNITIGCLYLRYLLNKFDLEWAIMAYNAGETVVSEWIKEGLPLTEIPYKESRNYLKKVLRYYKFYSSIIINI